MSADYSSYLLALGETSSSSKFDNLVNAIQSSINNIGDTSKMAWASGLVIPTGQLAQIAATTGQALIWNGSAWAPGNVAVTYRKTTSKNVVSSVTETDLLNSEITLAAGVMGLSGVCRVTLACDWLNNIGVGETFRLKIKLGSAPTTLWDSGAIGAGQGATATRHPVLIRFSIHNLGAANSQFLIGDLRTNTTGATTGIGAGGNGDSAAGSGSFASDGTTAVDTSAACALAVTVTNSTNSASLSFRLMAALIEVI